MVIFYQGRSTSVCCIGASRFVRSIRGSLEMTAVPEVVVESCNGVDETSSQGDATDVAHTNGDDG